MELFKLMGTIAVNNSDANKAIDNTTGKVEKSESKMSSAFKKIGAAVATAVSVKLISDFGKQCVSMASDVEEMQNKFDVVFQGMTDEVEKWADDYASAIGRNSNTIKGYLADNQNMFVGMGMTREQAAGLSEDLVSLALDLASFNNLNETDAVNAMSKALMGETESAKQLGAVLNDNTRAMAMEALGYKGKYDELTEAQKMEVNYQAILMQSQDAIGDCERSLDSYKGKQIQLTSATENLKETIGTYLLPVLAKLMGKGTEIVVFLTNNVEPAINTMSNIVSNVSSKIEQFTDFVIKNQDALEILAIAVGGLVTAIGLYTAAQAINNAGGLTYVVTQGLITAAIGAYNAVTTVATTVTGAFSAVLAFLTSPITLVVLAITALIAVGVLLYKNWDTVKAKAIELKDKVVATFNNMKNKVVSIFTGIKTKAIAIFTNIKDGITKKVESIKSSVTNTFEKVKYAITHPIETAKDVVKGIVDKIKGFFDFDFKIPKIKLPHFSIKPSGWEIGDLLKGKIPTLGIDWYAKAMDNPMLMTKPTAFGINANGQVMAGGEKGSEVVSGTDTLMDMIEQAVASQNGSIISVLLQILEAILTMDENMGGNLRKALEGTSLQINKREFARIVKVVTT